MSSSPSSNSVSNNDEAKGLSDEELYDHLLDQIKEGKCIAFIGAGFSMPAGIPVWRELLREVLNHDDVRDCVTPALRTEIEKLLEIGSQDSFDQAAQMLEDTFGDRKFKKAFAKLLKFKEYKMEDKNSIMSERLQLLHDIPFKAILTTNFDSVIKNSMSYFDVRAVQQCHDILRKSPDNFGEQLFRDDASVPVLQVHGSIKKHPVKKKVRKLSIKPAGETTHNDELFEAVVDDDDDDDFYEEEDVVCDDVHMVCTRMTNWDCR